MLRFLQRRYGPHLPDDVQRCVAGADPATLIRDLTAGATKTLEEFRAQL